MAREKKSAGAVEGNLTPEEQRRLKKPRKSFEKLERDIDKEFRILAEEYPLEELESLRWDYRFERADAYHLSREDLEYFVAAKEAEAAGAAAPKVPGSRKGQAHAAADAPATPGDEYKRKSDVDIALVEKYLERKVMRNAEQELASVYKQVFGEDLHIPERVDLADYTPRADAVKSAQKLTKAEDFGLPEGAKPAEEKKVEAAADAAPAVKKGSAAAAFVLAFKRGVPPGPGFGQNWRMSNPLRVWTIPKRFVGESVGKFYVIFLVNVVLFIVLLLPRAFLWPILFVARQIKRRVGGKLAPKLKGLQQKYAEPAKAETGKPSS
jgi:hypothetical protein